jgi:phosphoribosylaminoimidazolecarboxamide formyltransferase/IMP cyclohydrolase
MPGNAILSVYEKKGLDRLTKTFANHEIKMVASAGTAETIRKLGHHVIEVSEYTGMSEMPGGLVKTLHPKIYGGILGDWNEPSQRKFLEANKIEPFDFVVVNLYPFQEVVISDPANLDLAVDNIDIGGVALIRAAAKGALLNQRVVPVTSPSQYDSIVGELDQNGQVRRELRLRLSQDAFALTAEYDTAIRDYLLRWAK